jgi:hypothetical protein
MIINLTKEEWIEVIRLVDEKALNGFTEHNKYNDLKTKMLWQFGMEKK